MSYSGFDISSYPGDNLMQAWWNNSPFNFVGFYLAPAPNHSDTSWMSKKSHLESMGWGFTPVYVGRQSGNSNLTYSQGESDGANAVSLAEQAGFTNGTIYLDVETGGTLSSNFLSYIEGWTNYVGSSKSPFTVGIYCSSYETANQIYNSPSTVHDWWVFNVNCSPSPGCTTPSGAPSPTSSGVSFASVWQYAQSPKPGGISCSGYTNGECMFTYGGYSLDVDLNTASTNNPYLR